MQHAYTHHKRRFFPVLVLKPEKNARQALCLLTISDHLCVPGSSLPSATFLLSGWDTALCEGDMACMLAPGHARADMACMLAPGHARGALWSGSGSSGCAQGSCVPEYVSGPYEWHVYMGHMNGMCIWLRIIYYMYATITFHACGMHMPRRSRMGSPCSRIGSPCHAVGWAPHAVGWAPHAALILFSRPPPTLFSHAPHLHCTAPDASKA